MRRLLAVLLTPTLFAVFAPAAPVPKHLIKGPVLYYPTTVGTTWVYEDPNGEETLTITDVGTSAGARVVTVKRVTERGATQWEKMAVSEKGLVRMEGLSGQLDPPLVMLKAPLQARANWELKSAGIIGSCTFGAFEQVKVPAGTFETARVETEYRLGGQHWRSTSWYAPNVGLVKTTYGTNNEKLRALKSFAPG